MGMFAGGRRARVLSGLAALIGLAAAGISFDAAAQASVSAGAIVAVDATPAVEPAARQARWQLRRGVPVHTQLQGWAASSDWTLNWQPRVSWLVAADVAFDGSFEDALKSVIEGLFFEGKPVRLVLWQGNHLAEVVSSDAR